MTGVGPTAAFPGGFLVHDALHFHVQRTPDAPAMVFQGEALSYAELEARSLRVASALIARGLEPGDRVGIFMRKGQDLGPAIYGALAAGGVFVPLDPTLPTERLAFVVRDAGIRLLVSNDERAKALRALAEALAPGERPTAVGVDAEVDLETVGTDELAAQRADRPDVGITDQDLAYLMYTSGSTGQPKGMMHTHRGSLSYARWGAMHVGLRPSDRVASHAPLHFDLSIFDFFSTSQVGGAVVLVPEAVTKFPASWTETIESERISVVFTVPFTLIEMLAKGAMEKRDLSSLRWILFGGEPYPPKHLRALMRALPGVSFTNVYGPAEAPSCTCYDVPEGYPESDDESPLPIGTVSVGSEDLVLDEDDRACGVDEEGELCIRSSTLTRGYWNRPDLNGRVFFERAARGPYPDVFFRTGDVVVRRGDGLLYFLGRRDRMVKTRGHRVELDEVEGTLASHASVEEAAAIAVADGAGSRAILAAVTLTDAATPAELLAHARAKLPSYAVPQGIEILDAFPRTTSGKIDRRALAAARPESTP